MNLYLLRHGLAVELGTHGLAKDADRPLTPEGKQKLRRTAEAMQKLELRFELVLSSPYVRARETAEIVAGAFKLRDEIEFSDALVPGGSTRELIHWLNHRDPENALLVGHEPYLSSLISLLVAGDAGLAVTMKKGGLCKLAAETLRHGRCASLEWLLTPKQMASMA
jgi:phosphohistidine phosphatase